MSNSEQYPIEDIRKLRDAAGDNYYDITENAQEFLDDIEEKLEFCEEEGVSNMRLTEKQYDWLKSIASGEANKGFR